AQPCAEQLTECWLPNNRPHPPAELLGKVRTVADGYDLVARLSSHGPCRGDYGCIRGFRASRREEEHCAATMALYAPLRCRQNDLMLRGQNGFDRLEFVLTLAIRDRCARNLDKSSIVN